MRRVPRVRLAARVWRPASAEVPGLERPEHTHAALVQLLDQLVKLRMATGERRDHVELVAVVHANVGIRGP